MKLINNGINIAMHSVAKLKKKLTSATNRKKFRFRTLPSFTASYRRRHPSWQRRRILFLSGGSARVCSANTVQKLFRRIDGKRGKASEMPDIVCDDAVAVAKVRAGNLHSIFEIRAGGPQGIIDVHIYYRKDIVLLEQHANHIDSAFLVQILPEDIGQVGNGQTGEIETGLFIPDGQNPPGSIRRRSARKQGIQQDVRIQEYFVHFERMFANRSSSSNSASVKGRSSLDSARIHSGVVSGISTSGNWNAPT